MYADLGHFTAGSIKVYIYFSSGDESLTVHRFFERCSSNSLCKHTFLQVAFVGLIYPCLVLQYMGQAAFLSKSPDSNIHFVFFESVPRK
jgi:K+ transporter